MPEAKAINDEIDAAWAKLPRRATSILHLAEREPGDAARRTCSTAATGTSRAKSSRRTRPAFLHPFPARRTRRDRLAFARWLTDRGRR